MCLIFAAYHAHPDYRLIVAANRDEFYARPTAAAHHWEDAPHVLAGRDRRAGGTWLGVSTDGRFAALTNFRRPGPVPVDPPSRGDLVSGFLRDRTALADYLAGVRTEGRRYDGFSLMLADRDALWFFSNRHDDPPQRLTPGLYGLSNDLLDTPWPKVTRGKRAVEDWLAGDLSVPALLAIMADTREPDTGELAGTGLEHERERELSPIFIRAGVYGTRCTTVVMMSNDGRVEFVEKTFDGEAEGRTLRFEFEVEGLHA